MHADAWVTLLATALTHSSGCHVCWQVELLMCWKAIKRNNRTTVITKTELRSCAWRIILGAPTGEAIKQQHTAGWRYQRKGSEEGIREKDEDKQRQWEANNCESSPSQAWFCCVLWKCFHSVRVELSPYSNRSGIRFTVHLRMFNQ